MRKKALLCLFLFLSAFSFLRLASSSSRRLNKITDQAQYLSGSGLQDQFQVAFDQIEEKEERRMDIETNDYSGTGANNHHDPRPPGSS